MNFETKMETNPSDWGQRVGLFLYFVYFKVNTPDVIQMK